MASSEIQSPWVVGPEVIWDCQIKVNCIFAPQLEYVLPWRVINRGRPYKTYRVIFWASLWHQTSGGSCVVGRSWMPWTWTQILRKHATSDSLLLSYCQHQHIYHYLVYLWHEILYTLQNGLIQSPTVEYSVIGPVWLGHLSPWCLIWRWEFPSTFRAWNPTYRTRSLILDF